MEDIAMAEIIQRDKPFSYSKFLLYFASYATDLEIFQCIFIYLASISSVQRFFIDNIQRDTQNCIGIHDSINRKHTFYIQLL